MAGNARFHDKLHRKNHHTLPTVGYPDSANDPIASHEEPFQGDFVVNGQLSANTGISILSAHIDYDMDCENAYVRDTTYTNFISGQGTETIISDGALTGYGDNTLTMDYRTAIYAKTPVVNILGSVSSTSALYVDGNTSIKKNLIVNSNNEISNYGTDKVFLISPDSTPFTINSNGQVVIGCLSAFNDVFVPMDFQVVKSGSTRIGLWSFTTTDSDCGVFSFNKSYSNTIGTSAYNPTFGSNENIGVIDFSSYDAKNQIMRLASIQGELDHYATTVALSDSLPGRITFLTTTSGVSTVSERMRIDHQGKVGIGITNLSAKSQKLQVSTDALINGITVGNGNYNNDNNTAVGFESLCSASGSTNIYNTAVGTGTLRKISGSINGFDGKWNTAIGAYSQYNNVIGESNVAVGYSSQRETLSGTNNTSVGTNSLYANISGYHNTAIGVNTLRYDQGHSNTVVGYMALSQSLSTESNVAIGKYALYWSNADFNVAVGRSALVSAFSADNVAIGYAAGNNIQYGYQNVIIGSRTDASRADAVNQIAIGYATDGVADNTAVIGNNSISATILKGNLGLGTNTPTEKLHVVGNVLITGNLSALGATTQIDTAIVTTSAMVIDMLGSADALRITQRGTGNVLLVEDESSDTNAFVINSAGNVGIGVNIPLTKLHVDGSITVPVGSYVNFAVDSDGHTAIKRNETDNGMEFFTNSTSKMFIGDDGFVGIGVLTGDHAPADKFEVIGNVGAYGYRAKQGKPNGSPLTNATNLGYSFGNDGDTGMFSPFNNGESAGDGIGRVAWYCNNIETARTFINSQPIFTIGGLSAASETYGRTTLAVGDSNNGGLIELRDGEGGHSVIYRDAFTDSLWLQGRTANSNIVLSTNGTGTVSIGVSGNTNALVVNSEGSVGIGTGSIIPITDQGKALHVYNNSSSTTSVTSNAVVVAESVNRNSYFVNYIGGTSRIGGLQVLDSTNKNLKYGTIVVNGSGSIYFNNGPGTNTIESMRILSSGNIGMGTSAPSATLHVNSTSDTQPAVIITQNGTAPALEAHGNIKGYKSSIEKSAADTLTISELMNEYIITTGTSYNLTLDTAANLDSDPYWNIEIGSVINFTVLNTATGTVTLNGYGGATGITLKFGNANINKDTAKNFILRKTGPSAFDLYAAT